MKITYAGVSTFEQNLNMQLDALNKEGCKQVFTDKVSGIISSKPAFERLLEFTRDFYYWGLVLFLIIPSLFNNMQARVSLFHGFLIENRLFNLSCI